MISSARCEKHTMPHLANCCSNWAIASETNASSFRDRKSTRLNSSHSLHDALPILMGPHHDIVRTLREAHNAPLGKLLLKLGDCERDERFILQRSEEHTSELQSLPTRRSSDLNGTTS